MPGDVTGLLKARTKLEASILLKHIKFFVINVKSYYFIEILKKKYTDRRWLRGL